MSYPNENGKAVAVIGSRTFNDKKFLYDFLTPRKDKIKLIISGGARGADALAEQWAKDYFIPYLVFPAAWHDKESGLLDRGAGYKRNWHIISECDVVICFWDGKSKGSQHSMDIAKSLKKPVQIIPFTPIETL
jgi:hypothetical protein